MITASPVSLSQCTWIGAFAPGFGDPGVDVSEVMRRAPGLGTMDLGAGRSANRQATRFSPWVWGFESLPASAYLDVCFSTRVRTWWLAGAYPVSHEAPATCSVKRGLRYSAAAINVPRPTTVTMRPRSLSRRMARRTVM